MRLWPFGNRSQITRTRDGLIITIPAPANIFILLFLTAWLIAWAVAEVFIPWQIVNGEIAASGFILAFLAGWTLFGPLAIYAWLWMVRGKEYVRVTPDIIGIRRSVWSRGVERQFLVADILGIRVEYRGETVRFGKGLREKEARAAEGTESAEQNSRAAEGTPSYRSVKARKLTTLRAAAK